MKSVRISAKTAQVALDILVPSQWTNRAIAELEAALKPKRSVKLARARKAVKAKTKREETAEIRAAVMKRADGACEACRRLFTEDMPGQMDHMFSRREPQTERSCWALCFGCHKIKTLNSPSAEAWLRGFWGHALKHGFREEAERARRRLESIRTMAEISRSTHD